VGKKIQKSIFVLSITYIVAFFMIGWGLIFSFLFSFIMKNSPVEFVTYHGDGYTVNYPAGWSVEKDKKFGYITIAGNEGSAFFTTYDGSKTTLSQQLDFQLSIFRLGFKNFKQTKSKTTVTLKNGSWLEAGGTCDISMKGGSKRASREVSVVTSHMSRAGSIRLFAIDYLTDKTVFGSSEQKFFQPMWQSFKFL
jgi:hypothetical protein